MNKMKTVVFTLVIALLSIVTFAQESQNSLPDETIKTLGGQPFQTSEISNNGNPIILSFWATWCKPCIVELMNIADEYEDWQDETDVKLVAISIDDSKTSARVTPFINAKGWEYEFYLDENGDFKRAMNVNNPPHTFLIDGNGQVVWQHNGYAPGDEEELYELVQKLADGESISE